MSRSCQKSFCFKIQFHFSFPQAKIPAGTDRKLKETDMYLSHAKVSFASLNPRGTLLYSVQRANRRSRFSIKPLPHSRTVS